MRVVEGDLGTQMLRDFHVPERLWAYGWREIIWYLVKKIVYQPADIISNFRNASLVELRKFTLTKEDREILIKRYSLDLELPPLTIKPFASLAGDQQDELNRRRYRQFLKQFSYAQAIVSNILARMHYVIPPDLKEKQAP